MSGIVGSKFNHRGSGLVGSVGTDGQHMLSSGAGKKHVFETAAGADLTPVRLDVLALALKQGIQENSTKFNLPNAAICKFESDDDYDKAGSTTIHRNTAEYISSFSLGSYSYTTYTSGSGNFTVPTNVFSVEALVVAGGGGGAGSDETTKPGNAGGGGGVVHHEALSTTPAGTIAYAVGAGGAGGTRTSRNGSNGSNSTFGSITALGGGAGILNSCNTGGSGGGGGGSGCAATQGDSGGGTGYGNAGGTMSGGGAGGAGNDDADDAVGGLGRLFSNFTSYGVSGYFAGGGGGGDNVGDGVNATTGGGGLAGNGNGAVGGNGTANTGGGGGGTGGNAASGAGGSGFIGLRYAALTFSATGTALGTTNVPTSAVTEVSGVMLLKHESGSNTLGTDVKAYFTADNSNWTEATSYADAGTFSTGIKMIKLGKTTVTSGSDVRWKIVFANQVDGSKEAWIYGIGLNY